jgi:hypothetical protein
MIILDEFVDSPSLMEKKIMAFSKISFTIFVSATLCSIRLTAFAHGQLFSAFFPKASSCLDFDYFLCGDIISTLTPCSRAVS